MTVLKSNWISFDAAIILSPMQRSNPIKIASPEWRNEMSRYAEQLLTLLSGNLAAFSDTGVDLEAANRVELILAPVTDDNRRQTWNESQRFLVPSSAKPPVPASRFFKSWLRDAKPLLIVAPFGYGKSILLADLTRQLADRLKRWCQNPSGDIIPWVPFPVRLRMWQRGTFKNYLETDAQVDLNPNGDCPLTAQQIQSLREADVLLPLFDGLDELPITVKPDKVSIEHRFRALNDIWTLFPERHVLSCRPGYGVDESKYRSRWTTHTLRELDEPTARLFVVRRLANATGGDRALARYDTFQPRLDGYFRRPLFLAAWCEKAAVSLDKLPTTIGGLMTLVLGHVLDKRLADHADSENYALLRSKLMENQHLLGAVLALHAELGFDVGVEGPLTKIASRKHALALDDETTIKYANHALNAGLLMRDGSETCVQKNPLTEYLIGTYYAWLAERRSESGPCPYRKQFVEFFQRHFWVSDRDRILTYTFEQLWCGQESQRSLAISLIRWIIRFSSSCVDAAAVSSQDSVRDRDDGMWGEIACFRIVLRELLPSPNQFPRAIAQQINDLANLAIEQLKDYHKNLSFYSKSEWLRLVPIAIRWKNVGDWLFANLSDNHYSTDWPDIAEATAVVLAADKGTDHLDRLVVQLESGQLQANGVGTILLIGELANRLNSSRGLKELINRLLDTTYRIVWPQIVVAISKTKPHFTPDNFTALMKCVRDKAYLEVWPELSGVLSKVLPNMRELLDVLMTHLKDQDLNANVAKALKQAAYNLSPDDIKVLIERLSDSGFRRVSTTLAEAVQNSRIFLTREQVTELASWMNDLSLRDVWPAIATALGRKVRFANVDLRFEFVKGMLTRLRDSGFEDAWGGISMAICGNWETLSLDQQTSLAPMIMDFLKDIPSRTITKGAPRYVAWLVSFTAITETPECLTMNGRKQLLVFLNKVTLRPLQGYVAYSLRHARIATEFREDISILAEETATGGDIYQIRNIMQADTELVVFVHDVQTGGKGSASRIVYRIGRTGELDLKLNSKWADQDLKVLLGQNVASSSAGSDGEADEFLLMEGAFLLIRHSIVEQIDGVHDEPIQDAWDRIPKKKQGVLYQQMLTAALRHIAGDRKAEFCHRGSTKGRNALATSSKKRTRGNELDKGKNLRVSRKMLLNVLRSKQGKELAHEFYDMITGKKMFTSSWEDFDQASFQCQSCGAVREINDTEKAFTTPRPPCRACGEASGDGYPKETPADLLCCPSHKGEPIHFLRNPFETRWPNPVRQSGLCPCSKCRPRNKALIDPLVKSGSSKNFR